MRFPATARRRPSRLGTLALLALAAAVPLSARETGEATAAELRAIPFPDLAPLETEVATQLAGVEEALRALLAAPGAGTAQLAETYGDLGRLYHAYGLAEAAEACYANAAALDPAEPRWPYLRASVLQGLGRLDEATAAYRRALEPQPDRPATLIHLAEVEQARGRLEEAEALLRQTLELDPASAAAKARLGELALAQKRYGEAVELLEAALAAVPEANRLHYPLALAWRGLGEMEKARQHLALRGEVGVRPPDPWIDELEELKTGERVHLLRGRMAFQAGDYTAAVEAFQRAVESRPDSARARVNLGSALGQAGDRAGAVEQYRAALELDPANPTARFNLGVLLLAGGAAAEAAEHLAAVVEATPEDPEARLQLATALTARGELEPALPHLRRAVELDPAGERARLAEVEVLTALGRWEEARRRLEEAQALLSESGLVAHALARLLASCPELGLRDGERALELAERVFAARRTVDHAETMALALAELGRCEEAARWQAEALEAARRLGSPEVAEALAPALAHYQAGPPCRPQAGG